MAKVEKRLEADEVAARKQRDKDYQNRRKERLKELGARKRYQSGLIALIMRNCLIYVKAWDIDAQSPKCITS
ncbi:hypothetical protein [Pectobacterium brasiliense]|uniref:hypothetical protein n=1 Tax=Pectobacterium brasiliense TaxID=180957 RepID=UPI001F082AB1|nr:hypothetical protein [Pectobacterium brasiliense]